MSGLKKLLSATCIAAMLMTGFAANVSAIEAYDPYSYDRWADAVASQVGYTADYYVTGAQMGDEVGNLNEPTDMYLGANNLLYIADKGNNRIVVTDLDFKCVKILTEFDYNGEMLTLKNPTGVFYDQYTDMLYVCDTENGRVIKCDGDGKVDRLFEKPDSELYSADLTFNPQKVCVDKAGNVYVVVKSVTRGAVMFDVNGNFLGYFGANRVEATAEIVMNAFWNAISTEQQRTLTKNATPIGFTNFDIDDDGFIFTVTESSEIETDKVKKLNPKGTNILDSITGGEGYFGDYPPTYYSIYSQVSSLMDIDVGKDGEFNILDFAHGRVFQYDKNANLMFVLGGAGEQVGLFRNVTALESYEDRILVLDARKNSITVFVRTEFGNIVTNATNLYNAGYYEESYEPWLEVIKYDGNYRRAYIGIGNALFNNEQYKDAMKYFRISISRGRYSRAFEGYRDEIMSKWFTPVVIILAVVIIGSWILKRLNKKGVITFPWQRKRGA